MRLALHQGPPRDGYGSRLSHRPVTAVPAVHPLHLQELASLGYLDSTALRGRSGGDKFQFANSGAKKKRGKSVGQAISHRRR